MGDVVTLVLSVLAVLFAGFTLLVAAGQLSAAKDAIGGRAFDVTWTSTDSPKEDFDGQIRRPYKAVLHLVGPGKINDVRMLLDGIRDIRSPLEVITEVTATSEPPSIEFRASKAEAEAARLVVTWVRPKGDAIRTEAIRFAVEGDQGTEEWKWKRPLVFHTWRRRRKLALTEENVRMYSKPLGKWKPIRESMVLPSEGPWPETDPRRREVRRAVK
jgi:hypothetical protein